MAQQMTSGENGLVAPRVRDLVVMVFTDLDGTLLDHDTYAFDAARPALAALTARAIPVVPVTSKTLAELQPLMHMLNLSGPAIAENGAVVRRADGAVDRAMSRQELAAVLGNLPQDIRRDMRCFCDMDIDEIIALTGLRHDDAQRAAAREASEPFLWQGTDTPPAELTAALANDNVRLTRGGRFFHIVPVRDKAAAMAELLADQAAGTQSWALGDGPNDVSMLLAATRGAVIANPHVDTETLLPANHNLYISRGIGPVGWGEAITAFLKEDFD